MSTFSYEIAKVQKAQLQAFPQGGVYGLPWYLVVGDPGSGRSTAIRSMNLKWPAGDRPLELGLPQQLCTYWMSASAVFVEPGATVFGPQRLRENLRDLCHELRSKRPREAVDGVVVVLSAAMLADSDESTIEATGKAYRTYLSEIMGYLDADVPVYVLVSAYDTLWGFGDAFQWRPERRKEDPWGISLPPGPPSPEVGKQISAAVEGLISRIEAMCFHKLLGEDPPDVRSRALQHLYEARHLVARVQTFLKVFTLATTFERVPWMRALAIGAAVPGTGQRLRYGMENFARLGLGPPHGSGTPTPGGLPIHPLMEDVMLPERDLVPLRTRWRDDKLILILFMLGVVAWLVVLAVVISGAAGR
ncbi:MAG: hypothetical protein IT373_36575 [Polyangiaceae bacterium]|nr:hypothetical protein [Polyangiaceae bacterium]